MTGISNLAPPAGASYIPSDFHLGGRRLSPSYLAAWHECPMKWYWSYLHPTPGIVTVEGTLAAGVGLVGGKPSRAMLTGSLIHKGLELYYLVMAPDGSVDLGTVAAGLHAFAASRAHEWPDPKAHEEDLTRTLEIVDNYHHYYGLGGVVPDFPTVRPLVDDHGPVIERALELELPNSGALLTVRPDGMFTAHGYVVAMEHKSAGSRNVSKVLARLTMDGQAMAEMAVTSHHFRDPRPTGIYANMLVTDRNPRGKVPMFERQLIHYPDDVIRDYIALAERSACEIRRAVDEWQLGVDSGHDPVFAAKMAFTQRGIMTGGCIGYWGRCAYHQICSAPGYERSSLLNYAPKSIQLVEGAADGEGME